MSEKTVIKLEKIFSFLSTALLVTALVSVLAFKSTAILPPVFAVMYLAMMFSQVAMPIVRYGEIFTREKKMFLFPAIYGVIYTAIFAVFFYFYVYKTLDNSVPLYLLIALTLIQMLFPIYSVIMRVTDKHPDLFPLYYEDLQKKKEAERLAAEEKKHQAEEELRKLEEAEKKDLEEHPEKALDFDEFFFGDDDKGEK